MNKIVQKFPKLGSSVDPESLSLSVKSALLAILPIVIAIGRAYNWEVTEQDWMEFIQGATAAISILGGLWGITRKIITRFKK